MSEAAALSLPEQPKLAQNLLWFTRALRKAGLRAGPGAALTALRAVEATGFTQRSDFYYALQAVFVTRPDERAVFDQLFRLFWRDPRYTEHMMALLLPSIRGTQEETPAAAAARRAAEALTDGAAPPDLPPPAAPEEAPLEIEAESSGTASADEQLRQLDFEQMSADESARARAALARLVLPVKPLPARRFGPALSGRQIDPRASLRQALRQGGEMTALRWRRPALRWPGLVVLCDISGSMSDYSRMMLHFAHALANRPGRGWSQVHAFTFGTRLTNITRHLRQRDADAALQAAGAEAQDWRGGTRIGACLAAFNRDWARRVAADRAVVLLLTDGLEREAPEALAAASERLGRSCHRLIWLNPLLRWDGFAPKARGIAAMLPHVDCFRAAHNIASFEALATALATSGDAGDKARLMALLRAGRC